MNKKEQVIQKLKEKIGEKFKKAELIADSRFGQKDSLKIKFYESIIDGYIKIDELNSGSTEEEIRSIVAKIELSTDKERAILDIIDTYDTSTPSIKAVLKKYERYIKKIHSNL